MYKGTTPTIILTLPDDIDLGEASNVYVSFATRGGKELIRMTGTDISIDENVISVFLSQEETLKLPEWVTIQVNWTYAEGTTTKRAATKKCTIRVENNIINEVLA